MALRVVFFTKFMKNWSPQKVGLANSSTRWSSRSSCVHQCWYNRSCNGHGTEKDKQITSSSEAEKAGDDDDKDHANDNPS